MHGSWRQRSFDQSITVIKKQGDTSFTCLPHAVHNYFLFTGNSNNNSDSDNDDDGGEHRAASCLGGIEGIGIVPIPKGNNNFTTRTRDLGSFITAMSKSANKFNLVVKVDDFQGNSLLE